jgi:hypothetical protein
MTQSRSERRAIRRFALDLPVSVKRLGNAEHDASGRTRDVSSRGIYMLVSSEMAAGSPIEFIMTLPSEITLTDPVRVHCSGRIVRVERNEHEHGVAVAIDRYDFVGEEV